MPAAVTRQDLPFTATGQEQPVYFQGGILCFLTSTVLAYRFHQEEQLGTSARPVESPRQRVKACEGQSPQRAGGGS